MLKIHNLTKHYHTPPGTISVLNGLSFEVKLGEFVCIVGPSGCGKSTLLRMVSGLISPDNGHVYLEDKRLTEPSADIGLVFQKATLMPWRTVWDNIALPIQLQHLPKSEISHRVAAALDLVGLSEFADRYPSQLSGGMEQRVAIARALVYQPKILLLDEPFGALDALSRERLNQELLRIWRAGCKTVIMVTHNIQEAVFLADRVLVLTERPAYLAKTLPIPLPRPRTLAMLYQPAFSALAHQIRQAIG